MTYAYFITGTDTEIGKTQATCALLSKATSAGLRAIGLKPVAAGVDASGHNDDVLRIMAANNIALPERVINPWLLAEPLSPHIAARRAQTEISLGPIQQSLNAATAVADLVLVEGVGGLYAPLSETFSQPDLIQALDLPVILVVGLRLGCLNHALLTAAAIEQQGLRFAGWIGNRIDPDFQAPDDNIQTLQQRLKAPCLGILPFESDTTLLASHLSLPQ